MCCFFVDDKRQCDSYFNLDVDVDCFINCLHFFIESIRQKKRINNKFRFPIWFGTDLKNIQKKIAHKKYKNSNNVNDFNIFSNLRALFYIQSEECYRN